jgi:hypothetical protein
MTSTLDAIRRVLIAEGYEIGDDPAKVPQGGLVAKRGSQSVVIYCVDGKELPDRGPTLHVRLVPHDQRPGSTDITAYTEVPGVRRSLVIEK